MLCLQSACIAGGSSGAGLCGVVFPFFLLALIVLAVVGLFHGWKFMCLPLLLLLAGGGAVATYTPFGGGEEPTDGEVLKFLTYNVMNMYGDTEDESRPVQHYIQESDADVVCLQEYHWDARKTRKLSHCILTDGC